MQFTRGNASGSIASISATFSLTLRMLFVAMVAAMLTPQAFAQTQGYPNRLVRLVIASPAGGIADVTARVLASGLSSIWGHQVIVDSRPGANEIIASEMTARAAPDGYTLFMGSDAAFLYNEHLYKKLPYDPVKDFAPITRVALGRALLAVGSKVPVNSMAELVAYAKRNPGKLTYGSIGAGSVTHLPMEYLKLNQGINILHVPYKGTGPAIQDVLAGHIDMTLATSNAVLPYIQDGTMKGLAVSGPKRLAMLPDVPTFTEAGMPAITADFMLALVAPANTPPEIIAKIAADTATVVGSREFHEKIVAPSGLEPAAETPAEFANFLRSERPIAAEKVKTSGATLE